jgi:hypothetical protein
MLDKRQFKEVMGELPRTYLHGWLREVSEVTGSILQHLRDLTTEIFETRAACGMLVVLHF